VWSVIGSGEREESSESEDAAAETRGWTVVSATVMNCESKAFVLSLRGELEVFCSFHNYFRGLCLNMSEGRNVYAFSSFV
jgi:hypothetical protein